MREATVHQNSKPVPVGQDESDLYHAERDQSLHGAEYPPISLHVEPASQMAMEYFGRAVAELLECRSCYVAVMSQATGSTLEEARIGHAKIDPSCTATVERIARKGASPNCALLEPINARTFVRKLIGPEPGANSHSVLGRFPSRDRATVVFVAGWRPAAVLPAEIPCLGRAVRAIWETAYSLARRTPHRQMEARIWFEKLTFPAFIVDENLHIHELNNDGRALLTKGELLKAHGGRLAGSSDTVTESLKEATRETLLPHAGQVWLNTTVPLSTERQPFAFAKIGNVPAHYDAGKALVTVAQFDEVAGANRIASAFDLNWAQERLIARILQLQNPRQIGAELRLTEATVRTYTKRIMLKLGINRQSEFFLLYHLTQSPFGTGQREKAVGRVAPDWRLGCDGVMRLWTAGKRSPD
jgi:DNA-binding CsgD family transcriptional regulator